MWIEDKTDLIIIGTKQQQNMVINLPPVNLLGNDTSPSDTVQNLDVFESDFTLLIYANQSETGVQLTPAERLFLKQFFCFHVFTHSKCY